MPLIGPAAPGQNSLTRKPSAVIGTSPGAIGTAVGQQHLRSVLGWSDQVQDFLRGLR